MNLVEADDAAALLQRANVLCACQDGPVGRATISERAGCSRSTAYRATGELEERGLLERTPRGYRLTGAGASTVEHIRDFVGKVQGTKRIGPLFEYVDDDEFVRRADYFTDAELVLQDASSPYHIETRVKRVIDDTRERIVGMADGLGSPALADAMFDRIRAGVDVEWILPGDTYDLFRGEYGTLSAAAPDDDQTAVYTREEVPIDLALYDDTLVVIGFDPNRAVLGAVAITDGDDAREWALDRIEDCRTGAERVE